MADYTLREYRAADVPAISLLWHRVFGDPLAMTAEFFALLPDMGSAVVAEAEGKIIGAASVVNGFELVGKRKKAPVVGYLYAVMVAPEHRGQGVGMALSREAAELARRRESVLLCTLPADRGLYGFYHKLLGFECVLHRKRFEVACADLEPAMEMSATEYLLWRDSLLRGRNHLRPSHPTMEFERRFCKCFGGGLYACGSGICAAYLEGDTCIIKELITRDSADCDTIAASVGRLLGAKKSVYYLPAREGEAYLAAPRDSVPADCVWNLTFD